MASPLPIPQPTTNVTPPRKPFRSPARFLASRIRRSSGSPSTIEAGFIPDSPVSLTVSRLSVKKRKCRYRPRSNSEIASAKDPSGRCSKARRGERRSEEHTSELQSLMRISYAVLCLKKKTEHRNDQLKHTAVSHRT